MLNVSEVDRTRYVRSLGDTLGIMTRTKEGERERERDRSNSIYNLMNTYFLIFVLALICDCVLPLLKPGSSSMSNINNYCIDQ